MTEAIVGAALRRWSLEHAPCELVAARENRVYRVDAPDGPLALRLHRPGYRNRVQILSELQWMVMLSGRGLSVPRPRSTPDDELCVESEGVLVSMVSWLDGTPLGRDGRLAPLDDPQAAFRALGQRMARLHALSDRWSPPAGFERPAWDIEGLLGDEALWGRFWENPQLTRAQSQQLHRARAVARERLQRLAPGLDYGLIHADLVPENVLLDRGEAQLIDFDDGGFGFRLFDLATTVNRARREKNGDLLSAAVLEGYQSVRAIDLSALPLFRAVRSFTYLAWIVPRLNEAGAAARCRRYRDLALQWAKRLGALLPI